MKQWNDNIKENQTVRYKATLSTNFNSYVNSSQSVMSVPAFPSLHQRLSSQNVLFHEIFILGTFGVLILTKNILNVGLILSTKRTIKLVLFWNQNVARIIK